MEVAPGAVKGGVVELRGFPYIETPYPGRRSVIGNVND